ncbi:DUF4397 domain-containing protein [Jatrophihabitans telluris]|uniref:DUF4397 domain-containing protein n=1 Tax=Jatrophihabitans telluris TaxID=2038343 RepID=A0ABY4R2P3_9ACTN|nr:DUF4397 domain-containing protein [Jatrophihabitans telluris]UQX89415.1 DUF4397 domain-containing protein [Jatrophihabitans telluris]
MSPSLCSRTWAAVSAATLTMLVTAAGVLGVAGSASAEPLAPAKASDAVIRAAHFSPTTPGVDVYLSPFSGSPSRQVWLSNVRYGAVSSYQALTPGVYTVAMRPAGASPTSKAVLSWTLNAKSGTAYTVAGVGAGSSVRGVVISDDLSTPPAGRGRVRVIQAASRAPVAKVSSTDGTVIAPDARFATVTQYATLPAGSWQVEAVSASTPTVKAVTPVSIRSGQITSILVLDGKSAGITMRTLLDSSSSGTLPIDAVPAGAGGTAVQLVHRGASPVAKALVMLMILAAVATMWWLDGRVRTRWSARHVRALG